LDIRSEDLKIKIVGNNEEYTLEEAFQLLAGARQAEKGQEKGEDTVMNSEITAKSMHGFLERILA